MAIKSETHRGKIFAGETPLACSIIVEQTGPMQLTVRAGAFTTTGQRRKGPDRQWLPWIEAPATYTLAADQVIDLTSERVHPVAYDLDLVSDDGTTARVLVKRRMGSLEYDPLPAGTRKVHELLFEFVLPPACADITPLTLYALTVLPGFPPGTEAKDWAMQIGTA